MYAMKFPLSQNPSGIILLISKPVRTIMSDFVIIK